MADTRSRVCGCKICATAKSFIRARPLQPLKRGDSEQTTKETSVTKANGCSSGKGNTDEVCPCVELIDHWDIDGSLTRTVSIKITGPTTREEKVKEAERLVAPVISNAAVVVLQYGKANVKWERQITVAAAIDNALEEQWKVVYDFDSVERDRERGGLVLQDGTVNPGHNCFDLGAPLSPISQYKAECDGMVRLGDCGEVNAGWDHSDLFIDDPTTFKYSNLVYAHFHVHADNIDLKKYRCSVSSSGASLTSTSGSHGNLRGSTPAVTTAIASLPVTDSYTTTGIIKRDISRPASTPSLGDIAAWLCYHRNRPRAFVLTRDTSWLFFKWEVKGHGKGGVECPLDTITPWLNESNRRRYESILAAPELVQEISRHGFAIYTRNLRDREPTCDGIYYLWTGCKL